ncbi:MAG: cation:dicarboxylase symporter family transporter [Candidatus Obscuribacter sp.]|nr:cation:dicarboxylase symporter family transporter [Candidatus Obscuribacter sp.]MBP6592657.1 cation:dicarboxylase symporter family transporter [Candidatus Obscuribacter sp.]MBP7576748.1 cation:dicarboxylase symporter family transporter [Candidatus Obscuribacter sp.]
MADITSNDGHPTKKAKKPFSIGLTAQIFIGLVVGIVVGKFFPAFGVAMSPGADVFLHLIKTIIAPLVFATLVVGIAGSSHSHSIGRLGVKCFVYFEVVTTFALAVGLLVVNIFKPGAGVNLADASTAQATELLAKQPSGGDLIVHIFPTSIIDSMARGDVLQIVVFTIIFALGVKAAKATQIVDLCQSLSEVMFKYTGYVMKFAPIGVACAMSNTVGKYGLDVLFSLGKLVGTLYLALIIFVICVLGPVMYIAKVPVKKFLTAVKEPFILAFSTTSSEAALPKALQAMESIGVPRPVVSFVLPLGYTFNLDGTTLYLSLAAVFVAQAAGVQMPIEKQVLMLITLMLTSKGVAAVPRASLVILAGTLASFNLPLAGIALILGVDTLMDMARTSVNVFGNCLASVVLARWEGVFDDKAGEPVVTATETAVALETAV